MNEADQKPSHEDLAKELAVLKERHSHLTATMEEIKGDLKELRKELREVLDRMSGQKSFMAGVLFLASGLLGLIAWGVDKVIK